MISPRGYALSACSSAWSWSSARHSKTSWNLSSFFRVAWRRICSACPVEISKRADRVPVGIGSPEFGDGVLGKHQALADVAMVGETIGDQIGEELAAVHLIFAVLPDCSGEVASGVR